MTRAKDISKIVTDANLSGTLDVTGAFTSQGIDDNANATAITIDAGGSVLIGKSTPTDLHNTWNHLIIGEKGAIISENGGGGIDGISISDNAYIDSDTGAYAYQTTDEASIISQTGGNIIFSNAASGSAGAALSFLERMRITSAGNLGLGTTSPVANLEIKKTVSTTGSMTDTALHLTTDGTTGRKLNIGFGLGGGVANTNAAVIGFDVTSGSGATQGDLFFSTRSGTSDSVPGPLSTK